MAKILNLDAISAEEARELVLGGVTYQVPAMTVSNFIETSRIANKLAKDPDASVADQVEAAVEMIVRSIDGAPKELLMQCSLETLNRITTFIRREDDEQAEQAVAKAAAQEAPSGN